MSTFQKMILEGFLGADPQLTTFDNGGKVATLSVATTESWTDKQTGERRSLTEWHRVVARDKQAEIIDKYCKKGDKLLVIGKLRTRKWTDGAGVERYVTEVILQEFNFMGKSENNNQANQPAGATNSGENMKTAKIEEEHDDIPF